MPHRDKQVHRYAIRHRLLMAVAFEKFIPSDHPEACSWRLYLAKVSLRSELGCSADIDIEYRRANRRSLLPTEVQAQAQYALSRNQLDLAAGMILDHNHIEFDEAKSGRVSKAPDRLPAINGNNR